MFPNVELFYIQNIFYPGKHGSTLEQWLVL
jgi:hypothetical protein